MDRILHKVDFGFIFWCPGCGHCHGAWVNKPNPVTGARWTWNGNVEKPTFSPSMVIADEGLRCHLFVRDGFLQFLGDSTHALAGNTVPMEPF